jgi:glycosyltransferase involved in cell wall biosynthesis
MLSIIIPARHEKYLKRTIKDIQSKATGDFEIIVVLDGGDDERLEGVKYIYNPKPIGMKYAINSATEIAKGKYLMKIDAHCIVSPGFDAQLIHDHEPDWIQIPRRYKLNEEKWEPNFNEFIDYEYWIWPQKYNPPSLHGFRWHERAKEHSATTIDDTLTFQGSFWFMARDHWNKHDFMNDEGYNELHAQEAAYLGTATWMNGGRVVVNKNTWYCHLHSKRGYSINNPKRDQCYAYSYKHWVLDNKEGFTALIEKFWPLPNWPENWKEKLWES